MNQWVFKNPRKTLITATIALGLLVTASVGHSASEETYPDKPVKVIVPIAPGGSSDTIARIVADKLRQIWDTAVIVENVSGAGGTIGATKGAHATPDGYTLVAHGDAVVLNPIVRPNTNYELGDFIGANRFVVNPQVLVVHPEFGPKTLDEYVAYAKTAPGEIRLAVPTQAGIGHLTHAMFEKEADIQVTHIPYSGGGPAAIDTLGGHVDALVITLAAVTEYIKNGQLIALAVSTPDRSAQFPDVPTFIDAGYPNTVVESWQGMLTPRDTPRPIVEKLHRDISAVMNDPEVQAKAESLGFRVAPMESVESFNQWIQAESKKHEQTIREAGISSN